MRVSSSAGADTWDPAVPPEKQVVTYKSSDGTIKKVTKAELQEQLETSEKLMQNLNETWEEKLVRTQEVQKEREKALEELGITVEKNNVGVHTPKKVSDGYRRPYIPKLRLFLIFPDASSGQFGKSGVL